MIIRSVWASWLAVLACGMAGSAGDGPRIDQIQVIGSHNSYHLAPHANVLGLLGARGRVASQALDYAHRPLPEQFSRLGLRQIELDVFADPQGGLYSRPAARKILQGLGKEPGPDPNPDGRLDKPGFKVFHIQDIDYLSTITTFAEALRQVRDWSSAHPRHVPILVLVELKDDAVAALPTRPSTFGKAELEGIDAEIRAVFSSHDLLAPDQVRGPRATLRDAIKSNGWPALEESRGKVLFALDNEGPLRDLYLADHPTLEGRAMFVAVDPDHPAAAWMKRNDPIRDFDEIRGLVKAGFLVRTRADADTAEARKNDPTRREKALASGAQFISTDFPEPRPEVSSYRVRLPGDVVARSNPVSGDPSLGGVDLEAIQPGSSAKR
jgi:hypothetical protein